MGLFVIRALRLGARVFHVRVQLVLDGDRRFLFLVVPVVDLVGDDVAHPHEAQQARALVGLDLLLVRLLGHRVLFLVGPELVVIVHLHRRLVVHLARLLRAFEHLDGQRDLALRVRGDIFDLPNDLAAGVFLGLRDLYRFAGARLARSDKLHVGVELVLDGDVRGLRLVVLEADLVGDLIAHLHAVVDLQVLAAVAGLALLRLLQHSFGCIAVVFDPGFHLLRFRHGILHRVQNVGVVIAHLDRGSVAAVDDLARAVFRLQRRRQHLNLQGDFAANARLDILDLPGDDPVFAHAGLIRIFEFNMRVQRIGDDDIRGQIMIVLILDLVGDDVTHLHRPQFARTLVGLNLFLDVVPIDIGIVGVELQEAVEQLLGLAVVIGIRAIPAQNLRDALQALGRVAMAVVHIRTPDVFRLYLGANVFPLGAVDIDEGLGDGFLVLDDVGHAGLDVVVVHAAVALIADNDALHVYRRIALVAGLFGGARNAHIDHAVEIGMLRGGVLIHDESVRHRRFQLDQIAVHRADVLVDLQRHDPRGFFRDGFQPEVHARARFLLGIPYDMAFLPIRYSPLNRRALVGSIPIVEALGQVEHMLGAQRLAIGVVQLRLLPLGVFILPVEVEFLVDGHRVVDAVVQPCLKLFFRQRGFQLVCRRVVIAFDPNVVRIQVGYLEGALQADLRLVLALSRRRVLRITGNIEHVVHDTLGRCKRRDLGALHIFDLDGHLVDLQLQRDIVVRADGQRLLRTAGIFIVVLAIRQRNGQRGAARNGNVDVVDGMVHVVRLRHLGDLRQIHLGRVAGHSQTDDLARLHIDSDVPVIPGRLDAMIVAVIYDGALRIIGLMLVFSYYPSPIVIIIINLWFIRNAACFIGINEAVIIPSG